MSSSPPSAPGDLVAVDWGTTNRRAFLIRDGRAIATERDGLGIASVPAGGFAAEVARLRERWGGAPLLLAGMVGSNRGWIDAGYLPCPATLDALAQAAPSPLPGVVVVPGVRTVADGRGDVMRGEEVQLLGAAAAGLVPADALLCQPGTHCKWARLTGGVLTGFATAMTGELFALLKDHALIGQALVAPAADGAAFREGVRDAAGRDWLVRLFGVRPASLLGLRDDAEAASYLSGLLIGADCRAAAGAGETVHLLAGDELGALYAAALDAIGARAVRVDSEAAFVAGAWRLWEHVR